MIKIIVNGITFKKSQASLFTKSCVGVGFHEGKVLVLNTKTPAPMVQFTQEEWEAFLVGVKNGEFETRELAG